LSPFFAPSRKLAAERLEHGGPRIYDPRERVALGALDLGLRALSKLAGLRPPRQERTMDVRAAQRIQALRLDRLGDLLTTLPALKVLRDAAPDAEIELAVGSWNEPIARRLPFVDTVRVVDTPWAAWGRDIRFRDARRALAANPPDLAIDFQGDVRVLFLVALSGAPLRAGYGDTGGTYLLSHQARWDEKKSWYWQNLELVRTLYPGIETGEASYRPFNFVTAEDRQAARALLPRVASPQIGIHPSAGRALKQWEEKKFAALIDLLSERASVVLTGSSEDRPLVERIAARAQTTPKILVGTDLATFAAVVESFDVFVTGDTGPMHLSHAVATSNVAIFGPSDPVRYGPEPSLGLSRVVREPVFCSPCNMIRNPPVECARAQAPECIAGITVERVLDAVLQALRP
jgi:ADP-heptose:LPS heptosyltransferase